MDYNLGRVFMIWRSRRDLWLDLAGWLDVLSRMSEGANKWIEAQFLNEFGSLKRRYELWRYELWRCELWRCELWWYELWRCELWRCELWLYELLLTFSSSVHIFIPKATLVECKSFMSSLEMPDHCMHCIDGDVINYLYCDDNNNNNNKYCK